MLSVQKLGFCLLCVVKANLAADHEVPLYDRIKLLYGEQYALQVESEVGKGTRVKVTIPKSALNEGGK